LDEFVKNGGNLKDYFQIDGELDIDDINIEDDEVKQKLVLKEFLKEKGFSSKSIEKKLTKYEEAGLLEDEAVDALESLKEIREEKKQQLLEEQKKTAELNRKKQQDYFNSVVNEIKGLDNIRGVKIPEKDKKTLLEYIFKPTADGMTQYQKDWSKSVKNLLESAYFTMKGDTLLKAAKTEGSNKAISKFKDSLNRTGVSRKTRKQDNTSNESMWNSIVRQLRAN
jgi:DNA-binding transcriptional MerR regulator